MAQDQKPMTDDELEEFEAAMDEQREDIRKALAEDLGGKPEDYDVEARLNDRAGDPVADGGARIEQQITVESDRHSDVSRRLSAGAPVSQTCDGEHCSRVRSWLASPAVPATGTPMTPQP